MDQNLESRTIPLEVGVTKLFTFDRAFEGERCIFNLFYGNYIYPPPKNKIIHCEENLYKEKLFQFLNSKEGQKYIWPTEEEISESHKLVLSLEAQEIRKHEAANQTVQQEPIEEEIVEQPIQNPIDELELINLQKRVKVMLIVIVIQLLAIIALVALRLIKV